MLSERNVLNVLLHIFLPPAHCREDNDDTSAITEGHGHRRGGYWTMDPSNVYEIINTKPHKSDTVPSVDKEEKPHEPESDESESDPEADNYVYDIPALDEDSQEINDVKTTPASESGSGVGVDDDSNVKSPESVIKLEPTDFDSIGQDFVSRQLEMIEEKFSINRTAEDTNDECIVEDWPGADTVDCDSNINDGKSSVVAASEEGEDEPGDDQSRDPNASSDETIAKPVKSDENVLVLDDKASTSVKSKKARKRKKELKTSSNPSKIRRQPSSTLKVRKIDPQTGEVEPEQPKVQIVKKKIFPNKLKRNDEFVKQNDSFYKMSIYHKAQTEKRRQIFEDGVLKDYSVEALYHLQREKEAENSRRIRNKLSRNVHCQVCNKKLGRRAWNHAFLCHGLDYRKTCAICMQKDLSEVPDTPDGLMAHFRKEHFKDLEMKCNICPLVFYNARELHTHILTHDGVKSKKGGFHRCPTCSFPFTSKDKLEEHLAIHVNSVKAKSKLPDIKPKVSGTCEVCGKLLQAQASSTLQAQIRYHVARFHNIEEKPFKCRLCPKEFKTAPALSRHHISMHTPDDVRPYICTVDNCNKTFKMKINLTQHQKYHQPPRFKCERCLKEFYWKQVLNSHKCPALA